MPAYDKQFSMSRVTTLKFSVILIVLGLVMTGVLFYATDFSQGFEFSIAEAIIWLMALSHLSAGFYFLLAKRPILLRLEKDKMVFNEFFVKTGYRSGFFFVLFPYWRFMNEREWYYKDIECVELPEKGQRFRTKPIFFLLKDTDPTAYFGRPMLMLSMLTGEDADEIIDLCADKFKSCTTIGC